MSREILCVPLVSQTLIAADTTSSGGLTAFAMKRIFLEPTENIKQTKLEEGQNENRNNGIENRVKRNESV
jgi:hypothetical protein